MKDGSGGSKLVACNDDRFFMFDKNGKLTAEAKVSEVEGLFTGKATDPKNVFSSAQLMEAARIWGKQGHEVQPVSSGMSDSSFYLGVVALVGVIGVGAWYALKR